MRTRKLTLDANFRVRNRYWRTAADAIVTAVRVSGVFKKYRPIFIVEVPERYDRALRRALRKACKRARVREPAFAKAHPMGAPSVVLSVGFVKGRCATCAAPWKDIETTVTFYRGIDPLPVEMDIARDAEICQSCGMPDERGGPEHVEADVLTAIDTL